MVFCFKCFPCFKEGSSEERDEEMRQRDKLENPHLWAAALQREQEMAALREQEREEQIKLQRAAETENQWIREHGTTYAFHFVDSCSLYFCLRRVDHPALWCSSPSLA